MKEIKIIAIATIITVCIIVSCAYAMPAEAEEFYPKLTIVVNSTRIETRLWAVECRDQAGNIWAYYDEEGMWERGDIANLMMWECTEDPFDDEVIDVIWAGHTENVDKFIRELGWK